MTSSLAPFFWTANFTLVFFDSESESMLPVLVFDNSGWASVSVFLAVGAKSGENREPQINT